MLEAPTATRRDVLAENAFLRERLEWLRAENVRLRGENQGMRRALDAHISRAQSPAFFGPLEMTAGTCVGPRRQRRRSAERPAVPRSRTPGA